MATSFYNSLTNFWPLSEASGSRADSIGSSVLSDNNTVTAATGLVYANAALFAIANSEYLSAADSAALSWGDIDAWIAAWVYPTAFGQHMGVVTKYDAASNLREYVLKINLTGQPLFAVSPDGSASIASVTMGALNVNNWYLLVAIHDSVNNTISLGINNGVMGSASHTTGVFDGSVQFRVGGSVNESAGERFFDGRIGPVMMGKNYIPTAADLTYLYASGLGITLAQMANDTGHLNMNFRNLGEGTAPDINSSTDATSYATSSWSPPL